MNAKHINILFLAVVIVAGVVWFALGNDDDDVEKRPIPQGESIEITEDDFEHYRSGKYGIEFDIPKRINTFVAGKVYEEPILIFDESDGRLCISTREEYLNSEAEYPHKCRKYIHVIEARSISDAFPKIGEILQLPRNYEVQKIESIDGTEESRIFKVGIYNPVIRQEGDVEYIVGLVEEAGKVALWNYGHDRGLTLDTPVGLKVFDDWIIDSIWLFEKETD